LLAGGMAFALSIDWRCNMNPRVRQADTLQMVYPSKQGAKEALYGTKYGTGYTTRARRYRRQYRRCIV
jgi:hypothetical protein